MLLVVLMAAGAMAASLRVFAADTPAIADDVNFNFQQVLTPPGTVVAFAGSTVPAGWLLCDGSAFSPSTYPELAAAIGTSFGGSSGSPLVPNLVGRLPVGLDPGSARVGGGGADTLGETGGSDVTTQVVAHAHSLTINSDGAHRHNMLASCGGGCSNVTDGFARGNGSLDSNNFRSGEAGAHTHTGSIGTTGSTSVSNMPPYIALRFIIKT